MHTAVLPFLFFIQFVRPPSHVRNFILTNLNAPEAACNCPEPKGKNKEERRNNSTEILLSPTRITAGQRNILVRLNNPREEFKTCRPPPSAAFSSNLCA